VAIGRLTSREVGLTNVGRAKLTALVTVLDLLSRAVRHQAALTRSSLGRVEVEVFVSLRVKINSAWFGVWADADDRAASRKKVVSIHLNLIIFSVSFALDIKELVRVVFRCVLELQLSFELKRILLSDAAGGDSVREGKS
jgi:hypothetical protein